MSSLRAHLNAIAVKVRPGMAPSEVAVLQGELIHAALLAGRMELTLDEIAAEAMEDAALPVLTWARPEPVVIDLAAFRSAR